MRAVITLVILGLLVGAVCPYTTNHPLGGVSYIDQKFFNHPQFERPITGFQFPEPFSGFFSNAQDGANQFTPGGGARPVFTKKQLQAYNEFLGDLEQESLNGTSRDFYNPFNFELYY